MAAGRRKPAAERGRKKARKPRVTAPKSSEPIDTVELAKREPQKLSVAITVPTMEHLLTSLTSLLHAELGHLLDRVRRAQPLTDQESVRFARYVKALHELAEEDRAQRKEDELSRAGDEALIDELLDDPEFLRRLRERLADEDS